MANMCDNTFYAYSKDRKNIETIINFFKDWKYSKAEIEDGGETIDVFFESKWAFPIEEMNKLLESISNKDDIYMRCLSVEYGLLYHELCLCDDGEKWKSV